MNRLRQFLFRLQPFFRRRKIEEQISDELRAHLDMQTEANLAAGMSPEEARIEAQRAFGGVEQAKERYRDERGIPWIENFLRDLRHAARALRRAPGFSLAVVTTLALCLGPNTAILSFLYALVYKPLPFPEADRLTSITNIAELVSSTQRPASVAQTLDFEAHADRFAALGYFAGTNATLGGEDAPVRSIGLQVSAGFFSVLGVPLPLGRCFAPEEQHPGRDHVVVLTHAMWVRRYNADPRVLGREILLDDQPYTIVGVAPSCFGELFTDLDFFRPYSIRPDEIAAQTRYAGTVRLVGRLKPGVTLAAGRAQLEVLEKNFYATVATPPLRAFLNQGGYHVAVSDARQALAAPIKAPLLLLQCGAALVLLIGCVNVASLLLARTNARRPELAIRQALGAGRARLLRQMLVESFLLTGLAGVTGVALGLGLLRLLNHYLPFIGHVPPVEMNPQVLGVTIAVVGLIMLAMGLVPFALLQRSDLNLGITSRASIGRRGRLALNVLVVGQVGIALVLLVGAGLLIHSFARVMAVSPGFDAARIVQGRVALPFTRYKDPRDNVAIQGRILAAIKAIPAVEMASLTANFGVAQSYPLAPLLVRGSTAAAGSAQSLVYLNAVSPDYFATMGIRLREGRVFREDDDLRKSPVAIVDQAFAERYLPGRDVVGQEMNFGAGAPPEGKPWIRIIGVVARANLTGLQGRDGWPFVYLPFNQQPSAGFSVLVRSPRIESDLITEMRARLRGIDPGLPLYATGSLAGALDSMLGNRRALMLLLGFFAGLALVLAAVGLYGVLNYDVSQRTREIGIRGAIGATRAQIVNLILGQGMRKAALGLVVGLGGAVYLTRFLRKLLFDISPIDPVAFVAVTALLLLVAFLASWLPARRAAKVDPVIALRAE